MAGANPSISQPKASATVVASPCVDVCRMEGNHCAGCLRTIEEIAAWGNASDAEKTRILAAIARRRERWFGDFDCNCADT